MNNDEFMFLNYFYNLEINHNLINLILILVFQTFNIKTNHHLYLSRLLSWVVLGVGLYIPLESPDGFI